MNALCGRRRIAAALLVGWTAGLSLVSEDLPQPTVTGGSTNLNVTLSLTPLPVSSPGDPVAAETPPATPGTPSTPAPEPPGVALATEELATAPYPADFAFEASESGQAAADAETQRRLEAPTPDAIIEEAGSVGFLIQQPEPRNFLEIINPFAPEEFGPGGREVYNRDPNLKPGATLPRAFINDMVHEPVMSFLNWVW